MFFIESLNPKKTGPIEEIQWRLHFLSKYMPELPPLHPDGRFNQQTEDAVSAFQRLYSLPVTGQVNLATWNKIQEVYKEYESLHGAPLPLPLFHTWESPVQSGAAEDCVYGIQLMLNRLHQWYPRYNSLEVTGVYDQATEQLVRQFQEASLLPVTGTVDTGTWDHLVMCYNKIRRTLNPKEKKRPASLPSENSGPPGL